MYFRNTVRNTARNIAATLLSLAIAIPFTIKADKIDHNFLLVEPDSESVSSVLTDDLEQISQDDELAGRIIDFATRFLGRPYRYGSTGPKSFDCSGFTRHIFKEHGVELNRTSRSQYAQGETIKKEEVRPGDLLFFGGRNSLKSVGHVGVAVDIDENGKITFIHASTNKGVSMDTYPDGGYFSKRFIGAKRVL